MKTKQKAPKTNTINCDINISQWESAKNVTLLPNKEYILTIDYPFGWNDRGYDFKIKTGHDGKTTVDVINEIVKAYKCIYKNPEKYGVFGHGIEDLNLTRISVNHVKKTIIIGVDS